MIYHGEIDQVKVRKVQNRPNGKVKIRAKWKEDINNLELSFLYSGSFVIVPMLLLLKNLLIKNHQRPQRIWDLLNIYPVSFPA